MRKENYYWTEEEAKIFLDNYPFMLNKELAKLLPNRSKSVFRARAKQLCLKKEFNFHHITHTYDENYFTVPNMKNCYWAGFIAADGCIYHNKDVVSIPLARKDEDHLTKFSKIINYTGGLSRSQSTRNGTICYQSTIILCHAQQWKKDLQTNFNLTSHKTEVLIPPNLGIGSYLSLAYLAGLIDGDGGFKIDERSRKAGGIYRYIQLCIEGVEEMVRWCKSVIDFNLKSVGYGKHISKEGHTDVVQRYSIMGERVIQFAELVRPLELDLMVRKWDRTYLQTGVVV